MSTEFKSGAAPLIRRSLHMFPALVFVQLRQTISREWDCIGGLEDRVGARKGKVGGKSPDCRVMHHPSTAQW